MNPPALARRSIEHYFRTGRALPVPSELTPELSRPAGVFVTLHNPGGELRGCIGTTAPSTTSVAAEIIGNAVLAAVRDPRFEPVAPAELAGLKISVDVLSPAVSEPDPARLDPQRFGIIVEANAGRTGVLLPRLEGVTTAAEQIAISREKAGIAPGEPVKIRKFEVQRYEES
jgi:AmmeMemoRadiSam system protein A